MSKDVYQLENGDNYWCLEMTFLQDKSVLCCLNCLSPGNDLNILLFYRKIKVVYSFTFTVIVTAVSYSFFKHLEQ